VAAKSTTTSCFDRAELSTLSNSALECTECTEPAAAAPDERPRVRPLEPRPRLSPASVEAAAGGGGGAAAGGTYGARSRGGLPGKRKRRSTRSHAMRPAPPSTSGASPPRKRVRPRTRSWDASDSRDARGNEAPHRCGCSCRAHADEESTSQATNALIEMQYRDRAHSAAGQRQVPWYRYLYV
jgi:hypothetical protein